MPYGPYDLSLLEKDRYSITRAIQSGLDVAGWDVPVDMIREHWPTGEEIDPPQVWILMDFNRTAPWELGAHGKAREVFIHIYATNDSERDRLAEGICDIVRDVIPIYDWQDGNEVNPLVIDRFNTEGDVEFRPIRAPAIAPDNERWRAVVEATLTRQDA